MPTATEPPSVKPSLGLTGATMNAMALIAPGAFLWTTFQLQAAAAAPSGASVGSDTWAGIGLALILAFLSAISYAELAKLYPEAGFGSTYYFAEKAFLDRETSAHHRWARLAKLVTGWAAHLYYWAYPGVMVAFVATLIGYIYNQVTGNNLSNTTLTLIAIVFAIVTGFIASRGVTGSTLTAGVINVIQLITLVGFSVMAIVYRSTNPGGNNAWTFSSAWDVIKPHSVTGVLIQSTIAILILVGFESCTALAAETKDPKRNIPRAVILSLVIQGLFAYLFEYFAAGYMLSDQLTTTDANKQVVTGLTAAATSSAPLGDMSILLGNRLLNGLGFGLMISIAVTVVLALIGTTLSCMNTAARVTYAMSKDEEMPEILGLLHGQFATPALHAVRPDLRVDPHRVWRRAGLAFRQAPDRAVAGTPGESRHARVDHLSVRDRQRRLQEGGVHLLWDRRWVGGGECDLLHGKRQGPRDRPAGDGRRSKGVTMPGHGCAPQGRPRG